MGDVQTNYKAIMALNPGAMTGTQNSASIDVAGWDEAIIIAVAGGITATGTWDLKLQEDALTAFGSPTDIAGAAFAQFTNASQNTMKTGRLKLEAAREAFIRVNSVQATAAVAGGVVVLLLRGVASGMADTPAFDV